MAKQEPFPHKCPKGQVEVKEDKAADFFRDGVVALLNEYGMGDRATEGVIGQIVDMLKNGVLPTYDQITTMLGIGIDSPASTDTKGCCINSDLSISNDVKKSSFHGDIHNVKPDLNAYGTCNTSNRVPLGDDVTEVSPHTITTESGRICHTCPSDVGESSISISVQTTEETQQILESTQSVGTFDVAYDDDGKHERNTTEQPTTDRLDSEVFLHIPPTATRDTGNSANGNGFRVGRQRPNCTIDIKTDSGEFREKQQAIDYMIGIIANDIEFRDKYQRSDYTIGINASDDELRENNHGTDFKIIINPSDIETSNGEFRDRHHLTDCPTGINVSDNEPGMRVIKSDGVSESSLEAVHPSNDEKMTKPLVYSDNFIMGCTSWIPQQSGPMQSPAYVINQPLDSENTFQSSIKHEADRQSKEFLPESSNDGVKYGNELAVRSKGFKRKRTDSTEIKSENDDEEDTANSFENTVVDNASNLPPDLSRLENIQGQNSSLCNGDVKLDTAELKYENDDREDTADSFENTVMDDVSNLQPALSRLENSPGRSSSICTGDVKPDTTELESKNDDGEDTADSFENTVVDNASNLPPDPSRLENIQGQNSSLCNGDVKLDTAELKYENDDREDTADSFENTVMDDVSNLQPALSRLENSPGRSSSICTGDVKLDTTELESKNDDGEDTADSFDNTVMDDVSNLPPDPSRMEDIQGQNPFLCNGDVKPDTAELESENDDGEDTADSFENTVMDNVSNLQPDTSRLENSPDRNSSLGSGDVKPDTTEICAKKPSGLKRHICTLCGESYPIKTKLQKHMARKHKASVDEIACKYSSCGSVAYTDSSNMTRHTRYKDSLILSPTVSIGDDASAEDSDNRSLRPRRQCVDRAVNYSELQHGDSSSAEETVECATCEKEFLNPMDLKQHMNKHHLLEKSSSMIAEDTAINCALCSESFKTQFSLTKHMEVKHGNTDRVECQFCDKSYMSKVVLNNHIRDKHGQNGDQRMSLTSREKQSITRKFECSVCDISCMSKQNLQRHVYRRHGPHNRDKYIEKVRKPYATKKRIRKNQQCPVCGKLFETVDVLRNHIKKEHINNGGMSGDAGHQSQGEGSKVTDASQGNGDQREPTMGCVPNSSGHLDFADESESITRVEGEGHRKKINYSELQHGDSSSAEETVECAICEKEFLNPMDLKQHLNKHHLLEKSSSMIAEDTAINCALCSESFKTQFSLTKHMEVKHGNTDRVECQFCDKSYMSKVVLNNHMRDKHGQNGDQRMSLTSREKQSTTHSKFECSMCDIGCMSKQNLHRHVYRRHGPHNIDKYIEKVRKPYATKKRIRKNQQCPVCGKLFETVDVFRNHIKKEHINNGGMSGDTGHQSQGEGSKVTDASQGNGGQREPTMGCVPNSSGHLDFADESITRVEGEGHRKRKGYKCELCGATYRTLNAILDHMNMTHDKKRTLHYCHLCGKEFIWKKKLDQHLASGCTNWNENVEECNVCHQKFRVHSELGTHCAEVHTDLLAFKCDLCHASGSSFEEMKGHIKNHLMEQHRVNAEDQSNEQSSMSKDELSSMAKSGEKSSATKDQSDEQSSMTKDPSDEKSSATKDQSDEQSSMTKDPSDEKSLVTKDQSDEQSSMRKDPSDEKSLVAKDQSDEQSSMRKDPSDEKFSVAKDQSDEQSSMVKVKDHLQANCQGNQTETISSQKSISQHKIEQDRNLEILSKYRSSCCEECGLLCHSMHDLVAHFMRNHLNVKLKFESAGQVFTVPIHHCKYCHEHFMINSLKLSHESGHFGEAKKYRCAFCEERFSSSDLINTHLKVHFESGLYGCAPCNITFKDIASVLLHRKKDHDRRTVQCPYCHETFFNWFSLKKHYSTCRVGSGHVCLICGRRFKRNGNLKRHLRGFHKLGRKYICSYCGEEFIESESIKSHLRKHTGEKPYTCEVCGKAFRCSSQRHTHRKTHAQDVKEEFLCPTCGKSYKTYFIFHRHLRIHKDVKPYKCKICGFEFIQNCSLKRHMKTHGKDFDRCSSQRHTHRKTHAQDVKEEFLCPTCGKSYKTYFIFHRHLRIHKGVKPYKCKICGFEFIQNCSLKRHMKTHGKDFDK